MNWRRGFIRAWIVLSLVWIAASSWYENPVERFSALHKTFILRDGDERYEFPDDLPVPKAVALIAASERKRLAEIEHKKSIHEPLTSDEAWYDYLSGPGSPTPEQDAELTVNESGYQPAASHVSELSVSLTWMLLPPVVVLLAGVAMLWVGQGFRQSSANARSDC